MKDIILSLIILLLTFTVVLSEKVRFIEVTGNLTVPSTEILSAVQETKVDSEFDEQAFSRDLKRVFQLGYFSKVKPIIKKLFMGVGIIIEVEENPPVTGWRVFVEGPEVVDIQEIENQIVLEKGKALSVTKVQESLKNVHDLYQRNGYFLIDVKADVEIKNGELIMPPSGIITFTVEEHILWDLELKGDFRDLTVKEIKKIMGLEFMKDMYENPITRFFIRRVNYFPKISTFQTAYMKLVQSNFFGPKTKLNFEPVKIEGLPKDHLVNLVIDVQLNPVVEEGKEIKIIDLKGVNLVSEKDVLDNIYTKPGEKTDLMKILRDSDRIRKYYDKMGFPLVNVKTEYDEKSKKLTYEVFEKYIGDIAYEGLRKTKKYIIDSYVRLKKGKPLNKNDIERTIGALKSTDYFEDVNLIPQVPSSESTRVDIVMYFKEKKSVTLGGTISWGMPESGQPWYNGFAGSLNAGMINPFGYGQTLNFKAQLGLVDTNIDFEYKIPRLLKSPFDLSTDLFYKTQQVALSTESESSTNTQNIFYSENRYGVSLTTTYNFGFDHSLSLTGKWEFFTKDSTQVEIQKGDTRSLIGAYTFDLRDNWLDPRKGFYTRLETSVAGFGGSENYIKGIWDARYFQPTFPEHTLAFRGILGYIYDPENVTNFNVGNPYTVRGYDYTVGTGKSGDFEYIFNMEYRLRLENFGIPVILVAFYDQGTAFNDTGILTDPLAILGESLYSFGAGLRFNVPFLGILRLDWAFPLIESNWYKKPKFVFGFGNTF